MGGNRGRVVLTERDRRLLEALIEYRVVTRGQAAQIAGFSSVARSNARLLTLHRAGLLRRTFSGQIGIGRKAIYHLPGKRIASRALTHQLMLNEVRLALAKAAAPALRQWHTSFGEGWALSHIIPDALALLEAEGARHSIYIEADCGTESAAIIRKKAEGYLRLALSGGAGTWADSRFRVAIITTSERRAKNLATAIKPVTSKLFYISTLHSIEREGFNASHWLRPGGATSSLL